MCPVSPSARRTPACWEEVRGCEFGLSGLDEEEGGMEERLERIQVESSGWTVGAIRKPAATPL